MYGMSQRGIVPIKWLGTTLCLIGIALTSFNVYPLNIFFGLIGSGCWTLAGVLQNDAPLVLVEFVSTVLYAVGILTYVVSVVLHVWGIV
jgi:hypothetical protein